jgi:ADP-heptose:LPS heptosyltransferase
MFAIYPPSSRKSPLMKRWIKAIVIFSLNTLYRRQKTSAPLPKSPKRILVCNIASFGDVVISTAILPALRRHYPESEIGFLTSPKTSQILKDHPLVSDLHTFSHWYGNRERGLWRAIFHHIWDFRRVVKEIKERQYEIAIDLYPHFLLNVIPLLFKAKIPIRVGHFIAGYSHVLTHIAPRHYPQKYMGQIHLDLLHTIGIDARQDRPFPSYFSIKPLSRLPFQQYIVVHMGTANALKEWDTDKWIEVVRRMQAQGKTVVLTGKGAREQARCKRVYLETKCVNYCDELSWSEFVSVIQHAKLLISIDSVAIHAAAAVQVPCVALFAGITPISIWRPPYPLCKAVMEWVPCAPCLQSRGCSRMSCVREIQVEEVVRSAQEMLGVGLY